MKISTKIGTGYTILIGVIVAVLAYQVTRIQQMESINRHLAEINFRAAIVSLQLLRDVDQVEEFTRKYFATSGDPGYAQRTSDLRDAFSQNLKEISTLRLSLKEAEDTAKLAALWNRLLKTVTEQGSVAEANNTQQAEAALEAQLDLLGQIRAQTQGLIRTTREAIETSVQQTSEEGQRAAKFSLIAAAAALLLSIVVSFWVVSSISGPLARLTEGTRAVAQGKFSYRLDASGGDELSRLAEDFNSMTHRLSELDELKKDFISHVSHELKSPLASVQESLMLLLENSPGPLTDKQRRFLELNLKSCRRLTSLIDTLLDISRMEAGVLEYDVRERDLAELVRAVAAEFEPQLHSPERLQVELPEHAVRAECDGDRIVQVIGNLIGNGLKYSPDSASVRVRMKVLRQMPETVPASCREKLNSTPRGFALVSVADGGPGIPPAEREQIFEKFHRVKSGNRTIGAGLGLTISRAIVEGHGGAIWVEDNPGGGSLFQVLLPAGHRDRPAA